MSQQRSFAVALRGVPSLSGVYIDQQQGGLSFRSARFEEEDVLILAAYDVRSGKNTVGGKYRELLSVARKLYPNCELVAQWSEQDCRTVDEVPYIGRYSSETPNGYVATGFNKWGITNAMVAAGRISSLIKICIRDRCRTTILRLPLQWARISACLAGISLALMKAPRAVC